MFLSSHQRSQVYIDPYPRAEHFIPHRRFKGHKNTVVEFYYYHPELPFGSIRIEEGFHFNGFSVPKKLRPLVGQPFDPDLVVPGMIHDFLYRFQPDGVTKWTADSVMFDFELYAGRPRWECTLHWGIVALGGFKNWNMYENKLLLK